MIASSSRLDLGGTLERLDAPQPAVSGFHLEKIWATILSFPSPMQRLIELFRNES